MKEQESIFQSFTPGALSRRMPHRRSLLRRYAVPDAPADRQGLLPLAPLQHFNWVKTYGTHGGIGSAQDQGHREGEG